MTILEAFVYGLVQGITEFLPISSSGHLAIYDALVSGKLAEPLGMSILVHVASALAIIIIFLRQITALFTTERRLGWLIVIGTIPAGIIGVLFHDEIEAVTKNPVAVGWLLVCTGIILIAGELIARKSSRPQIAEHEMTLWQAIIIGCAQAVAILPGISRSGSTISASRASGLSRDSSVRFSFLLAIPVVLGAAFLESVKMVKTGAGLGVEPAAALAGFFAALASSLIALLVLIRLVRRVGLWIFSPYVIAAGLFAVAYF